MTFEEFLELNRGDKIKFLMDYWELQEPILMGTVTQKKEDKHIFITNIHSMDGREIRSPFYKSQEMRIFCNIDESINVSDDDNVAFKLDLNREIDKLRESPIRAYKKNLTILKDIANTNLKSYDEILKVIKENDINALITKVLVKEDVEKELEALFNQSMVQLNNIEKDVEDKNNEFKEIKAKINNANEELDEKIKLKGKFEDYGFKFDEETDKDEVKGIADLEKENYITYIQSYLACRYDKELFYKKEVLEQFYAGLCTNQVLVLSGKPGTGKTSLVEGFCNAIGAKLKVISVQPNWTDNQDLIGFYNPVENTYVPTQFLDAIIEAKENPEVLHIICLDEMNLAYVEYYFSEFLSKLQSENRTINLYSDYVFKQAKEELFSKVEIFIGEEATDSTISSQIEKLRGKDINEYFKLKKQWDSIKRYPSNIEIPSNLRFVGTINKDETTKDLSPKVVDRSYIMEVKAYDFREIDDIDFEIKCSENLYINAEEFKEKLVRIPLDLNRKLDLMKASLKKINIELTNRIASQIEQLCASDIFDESDLFDVIVATKILPKINVELDDENILNEIERQLEDTEFSRSIFEDMKKYCIESHILTFWR